MGKYDFPQVEAICYNLGINDAVDGLSLATRRVNVAALIAWKQKRYPKAKLVVLSTTPVQTAATESIIATMRTQDQADIAALGDLNILYCN